MKPVYAKQLFEGMWPAAPEGLQITSVVTDSRQVTPGCVFVAIKGERVDGHAFAAKAVEQGAAAVVSQAPLDGVPTARTVLVQDPLDAMITMGGNYRKQFKPIVLGVTGSVGKTTTKEFCAAVFSAFGETLKTEGNQNNEIGLPNTLFRLDEKVQYAIVEMGMQGLGEIHKLSVATRPNGAIITKIGTAHIQMLGSRENILRAKMEICDGLPSGAPLVLNADDDLLAKAGIPQGVQAVFVGIENEDSDVRARTIRVTNEGQHFQIVDRQFGNKDAFIPAIGRHNVYNALFAYTSATRLGLEPHCAAAALASYQTTGMRQNIVKFGDVTLIEDCYNASPDSMLAALDALAELKIEGKRIAVLGDMLELGTTEVQAHTELGSICAQKGVDVLLVVGELAALALPQAKQAGIEIHRCAGNAEAAKLLRAIACDGDALLVKASRGMQFEEILEAYKQME